MMSTDIGVAETSSTPIGESLQLTGTGTSAEDFRGQGLQGNTFSAVNAGQSFGSPSPPPPPPPTVGICEVQGTRDSKPARRSGRDRDRHRHR